MSDFIRLTMVDFNTHSDFITREILIRSCDIIAVHGDAYVLDSKCTEVITNMMDCKNTYFVKESVDEILRQINSLDYIDADSLTSCLTCKYEKYDIHTEPCASCSHDRDNWKPKEDQNESIHHSNR